MPVAIVAGEDDRLIEVEQSEALHDEIPHSTFTRVTGSGHMVHQTATETVMAAINSVGTVPAPVRAVLKN